MASVQRPGIDLPGEGNGILFNINKVGPLELATTAFGQGVSVTPIQQVMALGAVANGGKADEAVRRSRTFAITTRGDLSSTKPTVVRQVVSPQTAAEVRSAWRAWWREGSGGGAYRDGYRVAGKTGTAQVAVNGHYQQGHYIVSFIGMAPANNPQLVAYIAIDYPRPTDKPVFGGTIAAPIVGRILNDSLTYLNVPKSTAGLPKRYRWGDRDPGAGTELCRPVDEGRTAVGPAVDRPIRHAGDRPGQHGDLAVTSGRNPSSARINCPFVPWKSAAVVAPGD